MCRNRKSVVVLSDPVQMLANCTHRSAKPMNLLMGSVLSRLIQPQLCVVTWLFSSAFLTLFQFWCLSSNLTQTIQSACYYLIYNKHFFRLLIVMLRKDLQLLIFFFFEQKVRNRWEYFYLGDWMKVRLLIRLHKPLPYLLLIGFMWLSGFLPAPVLLIQWCKWWDPCQGFRYFWFSVVTHEIYMVMPII